MFLKMSNDVLTFQTVWSAPAVSHDYHHHHHHQQQQQFPVSEPLSNALWHYYPPVNAVIN